MASLSIQNTSVVPVLRHTPHHEDAEHFTAFVGTRGFEPNLHSDDCLLIVKQDRFTGDGLYWIDNGAEPELFRCQTDFRGNVIVYRDDPLYGRYTMPMGTFNGLMIGRVALTGTVVCRRLFDHVVGRA